MKTLILVRHAKSSHTLGLSSDFDRPLNDRGFREAAEMGKKLYKKKISIDRFVSSPAIRAKTTAELFAAEYDRKMKEILLIPSLYQADPAQFSEVVSGLDDGIDHVALFSHNPGITEYASSLTQTPVTQMPTSSAFAVTAEADNWQDFAQAKKSLLFFYKPD
jgi:phosphohistidine phosphatase